MKENFWFILVVIFCALQGINGAINDYRVKKIDAELMKAIVDIQLITVQQLRQV